MSTSRHRASRARMVMFLLVASASCLSARGSRETMPNPGAYPEYLSLVDGLHVTGTPIVVDPASYRLRVGGLVDKPLELSIDQVRALPRERLLISLDCPGFFTDTGHWTGVRVADLLRLAGYSKDARSVDMTSIDGSYTQTLSLAEVLETNVLVAYQFEDRDFAVYHGYPLRIAAEGQSGWTWVKWLGSITVR